MVATLALLISEKLAPELVLLLAMLTLLTLGVLDPKQALAGFLPAILAWPSATICRPRSC